MSSLHVGPSCVWTPDQDSVISGFTDPTSLYASLPRPHQPFANHIYQRPKPSYIALRNAANVQRPPPGSSRRYRRFSEMTAGAGGDGGMGGEVIEVQILPQDDNWGDNTTAITGNTSVRSESFQDITIIGGSSREFDSSLSFVCQRYAGSALCTLVALMAFISPVLMIVIPRMSVVQLSEEQLQCGSECDGIFISFSFKLLILLIGTWALFLRQPKATMPRIFIFRALTTMLIFVFTFSYWLFYIVRLMEKRDKIQYRAIVNFSVSLVDALLFIHYLAVILIEVRHHSPQYSVKVLRSPDGESRWYNIGQLSVQRAAAWVLEKYYKDFSIYNPYLDLVPQKKKSNHLNSSFKYYDVDGGGGPEGTIPKMLSRRRNSSSLHNERFYEEHEYERRVRKRKTRLIGAAEEAFTHIRRLIQEEQSQGNGSLMNPYEAAQSIFPSLARPLQKYLRVTRQQPRHTMEAILNHLALCLAHDMSPRAFLEKYLVTGPVYQSDKEVRSGSVHTWGLVCDQLLSRPICSGTVFQLRQSDVSLLCTVTSIPHFAIVEEIVHPKSNKFTFRLNSETSV